MLSKPRNFIFLLAVVAAACARPESAPPKPTDPAAANDPKKLATSVIKRFGRKNDGRLSEDDFARASIRMFEAMDKDHNGSLTKDEMGTMWNGASRGADTNADETLTLPEVLRYQDQLFKTFDTNHDGYLSQEELEALIRAKRNGAP